jgi:origin recognition complex subunit 1
MKRLKQTDFAPPRFIGEGTLAVDGNTYYAKAWIEGNEVSVGDSVMMLTDEAELTYTGKVLRIYSTADERQLFRVNWYQRFEAICPEQRAHVMNRELLLTESLDECPLDSILRPITVFNDASLLGEGVHCPSALETDQFFCNRGYLIEREELIALSTLNRLMKSVEYGIEKVAGVTKIDIARARLQLNFVTAVAGREEEIATLDRYLQVFISKNGQGGCIYVSGVPGTGKTLCVREVMRRLAVLELAGKVNAFQFYEVNCLRLECPRDIYSELWQLMTDEQLNPIAAQKALNSMFHTEQSPFYMIVMVDEIDMMLTPQQNELYCLLEWSSLPQAKFVIIAIANLMEFQSRLKSKIQSRMGQTSVKFTAYRKDQLNAILISRVSDLDVFSPGAIEQCAKTISNGGGDARKALESCKRALDLHTDPDKLISMIEMHTALQQISSIRANSVLDQLSPYQAIVLSALLVYMKAEKCTLIPVRELAARTDALMKVLKFDTFRIHHMIPILNQLISLNILKSHRDGPVNASSQITLVTFDEDLLTFLTKFDYLAAYLSKSLD